MFWWNFWLFLKNRWSCLLYYWWFPIFLYLSSFPFVCLLVSVFWILVDAGFNFIEVSPNFWSVFVFYDLNIFCCINSIFVMFFIYFIELIIMIVNVCICEIFYCGMGTVGCRIYFICVFNCRVIVLYGYHEKRCRFDNNSELMNISA